MVRRSPPPGGQVRLSRLLRVGRLASGLACTLALLLAPTGCAALPPATPSATQTPTVTPRPTHTASPVPNAGPPFPEPESGRAVYDQAGVLSPLTEASASELIFGVQDLIGAEIVVYTQLKPGATMGTTEGDAATLMEQWDVGGGGDEGVVVLFNLDETLCHGQVQIYAGEGYRAAYLSDSERQDIFEDDMLPLLRECDIGAALLVALERIDENARELGPLE